MQTSRINNVFISSRDNYLFLADIEFNSRIETIIKKSNNPVCWSEIDTVEKLRHFKDKANFNVPGRSIGVTDGNFSLLIPGGIDTHVHFDTPGYEFRDDFEHGSRASAAGGTTTVFDMPCTSVPPVTSAKNYSEKLMAIKNKSIVDYALWGGVRGDDFTGDNPPRLFMQELIDKGVAGFKTYLISGMNEFKDLTFDQLKKTAKFLSKTGKIIAVHAEDKYLVKTRSDLLKHKNMNNWNAYCEARDTDAEVRAVQEIIKIAEETGCRFHIVHLSSSRAMELISLAKKHETRITCETCPHYLHFTQEDFGNTEISKYLKTAPPVKFESDRESLWDGLRSGTIDFVTTDHAGCDPDIEKKTENFWEVYGGIPGVQHRVAFILSEGFLKKRISLEEAIKILSANQSTLFNLKSKGRLMKGFDADFCLVNPWKTYQITSSEMLCKGKYTPFEGVKLGCNVEKVYLRGNLISNNTEKFLTNDYSLGKLLEIKN
ncbi:MAG: allantoinase AllB [Melioribacteraceae bacterium]|nr:allantoinase AllB [Melioribacteraceae bacterium]